MCERDSIYEGHQTTRPSLDLLHTAKLNSGLPPDLNLFLLAVLLGSFASHSEFCSYMVSSISSLGSASRLCTNSNSP